YRDIKGPLHDFSLDSPTLRHLGMINSPYLQLFEPVQQSLSSVIKPQEIHHSNTSRSSILTEHLMFCFLYYFMFTRYPRGRDVPPANEMISHIHLAVMNPHLTLNTLRILFAYTPTVKTIADKIPAPTINLMAQRHHCDR